jgi:hypothetical protein
MSIDSGSQKCTKPNSNLVDETYEFEECDNCAAENDDDSLLSYGDSSTQAGSGLAVKHGSAKGN